MDRLIRMTDAGGVVVKADVAPRHAVDEIGIHGLGTGRSAVLELARQIRDPLAPVEFLQRQGQREHRDDVADRRTVLVDRHVYRVRSSKPEADSRPIRGALRRLDLMSGERRRGSAWMG